MGDPSRREHHLDQTKLVREHLALHLERADKCSRTGSPQQCTVLERLVDCSAEVLLCKRCSR